MPQFNFPSGRGKKMKKKKKRESAMRFCIYIIQTIISEMNTLQWQILDKDQNRIEISSKNPLISRTFQIRLTILHYYWGQVHLSSQEWIAGTMSCFLFSVPLPNRCPSPMVKNKYSSSMFPWVPVSAPDHESCWLHWARKLGKYCKHL